MGKRQKANAVDIAAADRRLRAIQLRKAGAGYAEIGRELGISTAAAHGHVIKALAATRTECAEQADDLRQLELERLDQLFLGVWAKAVRGELAAIDRALRIQERRARLVGLDLAGKEQADQLASAISGLHFMGLEDNEPPPG